MKISLCLLMMVSMLFAHPPTEEYMSEEHIIEHVLKHPKAHRVVIFDFFPNSCTDGYFVDSTNTTQYHFDFVHKTSKLKIKYTKKVRK